MPLITCPDCNNEISDNAASCPKCGFVLTPEKISEIKRKADEEKKQAELKAKKTCPACGSARPRGLTKCPRCGLSYSVIAQTGTVKTPFERKFWIGFIIFVVLVAAWGGGAFDSYSGKEKPNSSKAESDNTMAIIMMEDFVKRQLKSPSTATFPGSYESKDHVTYLGNKKYRIISYVDSQNGFGAMIRSHYIGEVCDEGNNRWSLLSLEFADR